MSGLVSGRAPVGATAATVIDDRGDEHRVPVVDGAYAVDLGDVGFSEPLVRFEDADGALVAAPLPDGPRTRVEDARDPCPVCAARAWVQLDDGLRCERCGFDAGALWGTMAKSVAVMPGDPIALAPGEESPGERRDRERREALAAALTFPVYAVPDCGAYLSSFDEDATYVSITHRAGEELDVVTGTHPEVARGDLRDQLTYRLDPPFDEDAQLSPAARQLSYDHADRLLRRRVARLPVRTRELLVDGAPVPFAFLALDEAWVARAELGGATVTIAALEVPPEQVTLGRLLDVTDPSAGTTVDAPPRDVTSRAGVERLIADCGLEAHRERILASIRPGYRLEEADDGPHRMGGLPDLAPGETWPLDEEGEPYTFVAQIDCSALPPLPTGFGAPAWDHGGALLRIFAAVEGAVEEFPAVVLACPADAPLTRASGEDLAYETEEQHAQAVPSLTTVLGYGSGADDEAREAFAALDQELKRGATFTNQLLGHARSPYDDDVRPGARWGGMEDEDPDQWWVLAMFNTAGFEVGDGHGLAFMVPAEDLAAGRYDRVVTEMSTG
ncbi:DUF1963 domain-containing protein [Solirubrobacter phytolaccae]|uniref:DUF1963 domain-containing protein n=1 Tax=Solirubrobacter phytolaccae TaxID=1404360 RepID=A0A9X3S5B7_9ACTN|nr:DUF1963 domain-containing protein [Solirubrobacter phytolaccae]MDA0178729.1 DUF1963 domain-containing protein [Solirubrobacter phytolaccae]